MPLAEGGSRLSQKLRRLRKDHWPIWDWLELLIIPVVLGLSAFWFNNQARKSEQAISRDQVREDALRRYLDRISELVLDKNLWKSKQDDAVRATARARTFTVLRSLDGYR
jgi:hypothetical protein